MHPLPAELYSFKAKENSELCSELSMRHRMDIVSSEETLAPGCCFLVGFVSFGVQVPKELNIEILSMLWSAMPPLPCLL